jgi:predicted transposase/invertase (TIGR01784 family)
MIPTIFFIEMATENNYNIRRILMTKETQLNMQMKDEDELLAPLQKLNLMDDFLFDVTTVDLGACKAIIELSLNIHIKKIQWKEGQKVTHNLPGKRGIRMDFYVEDVEGQIFNVEMQKRNRGNIPKRTRFYQGLLDAPLLKSGEESFDNLRPTYIIVICSFDLFHQSKYRYTFTNMCKEVQGLELGDDCTKIILNTKGKNDDEVEKPLVNFLHYIEHSTDENVTDDSDERLKYLHGIVQKIRANAQMGVTYMTMEERDRQIREDGKLEGEIKAYLKVGLSVKQITEMMDLPEDKVLEIIQKLK